MVENKGTIILLKVMKLTYKECTITDKKYIGRRGDWRWDVTKRIYSELKSIQCLKGINQEIMKTAAHHFGYLHCL